MASISLALKLAYNRGGETHTHSPPPPPQKLGAGSTERAKKMRGEREKWYPSLHSPKFLPQVKKKVDKIKANVFLGTGM